MLKGKYIRTREIKCKMSKAQKGKILSDEHKQKISKNHARPMLGKHHSDETKARMSEVRKGQIPWNKGLTKKTDERVRKNSEALMGRLSGMEGKTHTKETKQKMRISAMNRLINNKVFPNFNKVSIQFFDILNKVIFDDDGQYGVNEYCIPALGYWLDFVSHKYKTIIEYDEECHKYQLEKDTIRQSNIQIYYPDYIFIRIKEDNAKINILTNLFANKIKAL